MLFKLPLFGYYQKLIFHQNLQIFHKIYISNLTQNKIVLG